MNSVVYKYNLKGIGVTTLDLPKGAEVLTVNAQRSFLCLWASVDPDAETEQREFLVIGTGHKLNFDLKKENYIGTIHQMEGSFFMTMVWHVFEI